MNPTVTLRLTADNSQLVPTVRASEAEVKRLGTSAATTGQQAQRGSTGITALGNASEGASRKASAMGAALNVARSAMGAYLGAQSVSALISMSDQYANISGRLRLATDSQKSYATASAEVYAISQRTSTAMESTATLYARLAQSTAEYGVSQQRQLALTETINRSFTISGASATAASNTITQFTQALAGGVLRAEEFNSVVENSPRLAKALADGMGVGMGELRKQVNDGQVTIDKLVTALESQSGAIQAEFERMPLTVERAMVQLRNSVTKYVGETSSELGAGGALAEGIAVLARNMDQVDKIVGVLAVAFGGRLVANLVQATAAKITAAAASRELARQELVAAQAAERMAVGQLSMARAGMGAAGGVVAAEQAVAAAQLRTAAAAQASSIALTAKAAAMRGLNVAMGAFGGPVGLAITALTLFVMWMKNSKDEADQLASSVKQGFQSAVDTLGGFKTDEANRQFASLAESYKRVDEAQELVEKSAKRVDQITQENRASQQEYGLVLDSQRQALADANRELQKAENAHANLDSAAKKNIGSYVDLILKQTGLSTATSAQRAETEKVVRELASEGQTLDQLKPLLGEHMRSTYGVEAANRLAGASFDQVATAAQASGGAIKAALQSINEGLDKQIDTLQLQLIEKTQGKAARMRAEFIKSAAGKGLDPTSAEYQQARAKNEQIIQLSNSLDQQTKATQSLSRAESDAKRAKEENDRLVRQQADSQAKYTAEAAMAAAELRGPLAAAQEQHAQRIKELDRELEKHNITLAARNTLEKASAAELAKQDAELTKRKQAPTALLDTMSGEVRMLGVLGEARERYARQLRNEQDMLQAINEANEAGAGINAATTQRLVEQARAWADVSLQVEKQTANLQEWADVGTRGVADFADLFADTLSGNLDDSEGFFDRLKDIFKRGWRDVLRTLLEQNMVRPFQEALTNAINGAFSGAANGSGGTGGNWLSNIVGMFGGGSSGGTGTNWMSSLAGLIGGGRNLTGTNAMNAGNGWMNSAMSGAGSMMGFGSNIGAFSGAGAGAGAGAASSASMAVPIIGWVIAGMMKNAELFDEGWDIANGESWAGKAATLGAVSHADDMFRKIGFNDKTASILSGSSIHSKLFGRKKPQIQAQGIVGSYGFDGLTGQSYADIKAKGGMFRSDKKWTDYGQLDSAVTDAFGSAISRAKAGVVNLADQLGVDISSQLSTVRVDLGKVSLDADPEKAQAQLEQLMSTAVSNLAGRGVGILGFQEFLGKGFEAGDVMTTLAASIELMTGNARDLGRALNAEEVDLVKRTTSMFQRMAKAAGTTMEEQVVAITTAASSYGGVVGSAQQEIATDGFSGFAKSLLAIRQEERERTRTLQDQAKALNGLSAREQDLATVREAAQIKADALARSLESELVDLALNRVNDQIERLGGSIDGAGSKIEDFINSLKLSDTLSTDTDAQKRGTADDLMASAAASGNIDSFTQYAQQFLQVSRNLNASGAGYQADYARVLELANSLGGDGTSSSLEQLYEQQKTLQVRQEAAARLERAQRIAQGVSDLAGVRGTDPLEILRSVTGMTAEDLAADLGLTTEQLGKYLAEQQTDISDLADILYDLPKRIAQEMITALVDGVPSSSTAGTGAGNGASSGGGVSVGGNQAGANNALLEVLLRVDGGIQSLVKTGKNVVTQAL